MQDNYVHRKIHTEVLECLRDFPAVAILGARQCGKSTLALRIVAETEKCTYLDLERPSDLNKLSEPELFLDLHRKELVCLDEIQRVPGLFAVLRSVMDEREREGQFLILGSASRELIRQSSESLAGRIAFLELTPFLLSEIISKHDTREEALSKYWLRGGFPRSYLARSDKSSLRWRHNFVRTFLERDIHMLGFQIPPESLARLLQMCAHNHGQILNASRLGESIGVSHTTIRSYMDILKNTFMIRILPPFSKNLRKRLVKSPKIYIRDTGILHALLDIESPDDIMGHPVYGASWEGMVIENAIEAMRGWKASFYRTSAGAELDLVFEKGRKRIGVECKASASPHISRGFWNSLHDLAIDEAWIIAPVKAAYPVEKNVVVTPLHAFMEKVKEKYL